MPVLPQLPKYIPDTVKSAYPGLHIPANTEWSQYNIHLEPGEDIEIKVRGQIVYYYRTWTERGSCGKRKRRVDRRVTPPKAPHGLTQFGIGAPGSSRPTHVVKNNIAASTSFPVPPGCTGRLHSGFIDTMAGFGDNSGSFQFDITIDTKRRIESFVVCLQKSIETVGTKPPHVICKELISAFPARMALYDSERRRALELMTELGKKLCAPDAPNKDALSVADWLGEWTTTETSGGLQSFGLGYQLRAAAAMKGGDLVQTATFLTQAIKYSDDKDKGRLMYDAAKLKEFKGDLFSASTVSIDRIGDAELLGAAELMKEKVGAYDLYRLSLLYFNKLDGLHDDARSPFKALMQYDNYYALGRLDFMRYTTESLRSSAQYFRFCRRLARFRFLTHPSQYHNYHLDLLFNDTRRSHRNPCYRATTDSEILIALENIKIDATLYLDGKATVNGEDIVSKRDVDIWAKKHMSWYALNCQRIILKNQNIPKLNALLKKRNNELNRAVFLATNNAALPESGFWFTSDRNGEVYADRVVENLVDVLHMVMSEYCPDEAAHFGSLIQNPSCWIEVALRHFSNRFDDGWKFDLSALDYSLCELTEVTSDSVGERHFANLKFTNQHGHTISAKASIWGERLSLDEITYVVDNTPIRVAIDYKDAQYPRLLTNVRVSYLKEDLSEAYGNIVEINLEYSEKHPALVRRVVIKDGRGKIPYEKLLSDQVVSHYDWRLKLEFDEEENRQGFIDDHQSLAKGYIPFHNNTEDDAFADVIAKDLRWAISKSGYQVYWQLMLQQVVKRLRNKSSDSSPAVLDEYAILRNLLFDIVSTPESVSRHIESNVPLRMLGAIGLIIEPSSVSDAKGLALYREKAYRFLVIHINTLLPNDPGNLPLLDVLKKNVVQLSLPPTKPVLELGIVAGDGSANVSENNSSRQPLATLESKLTLTWLDALVRFSRAGDHEMSNVLIRQLHANGLYDIASIYLGKQSLDIPSSNEKASINVYNEQRIIVEQQISTIKEILVKFCKTPKANAPLLDAEGKISCSLIFDKLGYYDKAKAIRETELENSDHLRMVVLALAQLLNLRLNKHIPKDPEGKLYSDALEIEILYACKSAHDKIFRVEFEDHVTGVGEAAVTIRKEKETEYDLLNHVFAACFRALSYFIGATWKEHLKAALENISIIDDGEDPNPIVTNWNFIIEPFHVASKQNLPKVEMISGQAVNDEGVVQPAANRSGVQRFHMEMNTANLNSWESILHDEPYSDCVLSLLALSDRLAARNDRENAQKVLQQALRTLVKLSKEEYQLISPTDRQNLTDFRQQVSQRLSMLAQNRDAYGQFLTKSPPRRLDVVAGEFAQYLKSYKQYLDRSISLRKERERQGEKLQRIELETSALQYDIQEAEYMVERQDRILAETNQQLTQLQSERREQFNEAERGAIQYRRGKKKAEKAVEDIGSFVAAAAASFIPAATTALGVTSHASKAKEIVKAFSTAQALQKGEDPLKAMLSNYGNDILSISFSSFGDGMYTNEFKDIASNSLNSYLKDGKIDLGEQIKTTALKSMRELGEALYETHLSGFSSDVEKLIEDADEAGNAILNDVKKNWNLIKMDIEAGLDTLEFSVEKMQEGIDNGIVDSIDEAANWVDKPVSQFQQFLQRAELTADAKIDAVKNIIDSAEDEVIKELKSKMSQADFPLSKIVNVFEEMVNVNVGGLDPLATEHAVNALDGISEVFFKSKTWENVVTGGEKEKRLAHGAKSLDMLAQMVSSLSQAIILNGVTGIEKSLAIEGLSRKLNDLLKPGNILSKLGVDLPLPLERICIACNLPVDFDSSIDSVLDGIKVELAVLIPGKNDAILSLAMQRVATVATELSKQLQFLDEKIGGDLVVAGGRIEDICNDSVEGVGLFVNDLLNETSERTEEIFGNLRKSVITAGGFIEDLEDSIHDTESSLDDMLNNTIDMSLEDLLGDTNDKFSLVIQGVIRVEESPATPVRISNQKNGLLATLLNVGKGTAVESEQFSVLDNVELKDGFKIAINKESFASKEARDSYVATSAAEVLWRNTDQRKEAYETINDAENQRKTTELIDKSIMAEQVNIVELPESEEPPQDALENALGNSSVQAVLAAVSTMYPAIGMAIQAVQLVNNWLKGTGEQNDGAKRVDSAEQRVRSIDKDITSALHRRELSELDKLIAKNSVSKHTAQLDLMGSIQMSTWDNINADVYLRRVNYRRSWASLHLLSYQLYVLQRAFEYEFDVPIELMFKRWPQLEALRPLLELSPGILEGEFSRTNVHEDMLNYYVELDALPTIIDKAREIVEGRRFLDTITVSLRGDFGSAWETFQSGGLPRFETPLRMFMGVGNYGRELRYGFKIRSVTMEVITKRDGATIASRSSFDFYDTLDDVRDKEKKRRTPTEVVSTTALGESETELIQSRRKLARLKFEYLPDRFKVALLHSGAANQISESGAIYEIEWAPQMVDTNLGVLDPEQHHNPAEGLSPATIWTLLWDPDFGLNTLDIEDIKISIKYSYLRNYANLHYSNEVIQMGEELDIDEFDLEVRDCVKGSIETKFNEVLRLSQLNA